MARHNDLGKKGEELALAYLQKLGHRILELNWRIQKAEIDIISMDRGTLVITEVKTRGSYHFGEPEEFVSSRKMRMLVDAGCRYAECIGHDDEVRFDIIGVVKADGTGTEVHHFKDAFFPEIE